MAASPEEIAEQRRLVERCLTGDETVWDEFVRRLTPTARAAAERSLRNSCGAASPADLDDALQAALSAIIENDCAVLRRFKWGCSLETYVSVIAARAGYDLAAARSRETRVDVEGGRLRELRAGDAVAGSPAGSKEASMILEESLDALPPAQALSARLYYLEGYSAKEIAGFRSVPYGTVTSDLGRARRKLREMLSED